MRSIIFTEVSVDPAGFEFIGKIEKRRCGVIL